MRVVGHNDGANSPEMCTEPGRIAVRHLWSRGKCRSRVIVWPRWEIPQNRWEHDDPDNRRWSAPTGCHPERAAPPSVCQAGLPWAQFLRYLGYVLVCGGKSRWHSHVQCGLLLRWGVDSPCFPATPGYVTHDRSHQQPDRLRGFLRHRSTGDDLVSRPWHGRYQ